MAIGLLARLSRFTLYAYVVPLACIPVLAPLAGSINNDNAAFAAGELPRCPHGSSWPPGAVRR
jgi:hypothetical protein